MFKHIKFLLILIAFVNQLHCQIICRGKKAVLIEDGECPTGRFVLTFEDNFDGNVLDTNKWRAKTAVVRDPDHKSEQQWFLPQNAVVSDGTLKLIAKRDTFINQCYDLWINDLIGVKHFCQDFFFSAAEIASKENFGHGKLEISCKLPKGKGLGTAFWMWVLDQQSEIDVFEFINEKDVFGKFDSDKLSKVHRMNSHFDYGNNGVNEDCPTHYKGPDFSAKFHTFTVIWTPHMMQWYVDGDLKRSSALFYSMTGQMLDCKTLKKYEEYILNRAFPMHPMHIITTLTTQSGGNQPDDNTSLPAQFEIDYIKYYKYE